MPDTLEVRRKRLRYQCWHRGTKELDLLVGRFSDDHLADFGADELDHLEALLEVPEPLLYDWILGRSEPTPDHDTGVLSLLRAHSAKTDKT